MADEIINNSSPDISGILGELLTNKELMSKISEIAGTQNPQVSESTAQTSANTGIDSLLTNPDIMSKLPEVISVIKPLVSNEKGEEIKNTSFDKRMGLLMAMKPYLSPKRCEAIDYIARMSKLSETFKGLKL